MCFNSEDGGESSILVQFHDVSIHHSMHISNYFHHTLAALSPQALALSCISSEEIRSKLVVVVLQGEGFRFQNELKVFIIKNISRFVTFRFPNHIKL